MITITSVAEMKATSRAARSSGRSIGFVPTMGYLHEGHLSLVRASRQACGLTVVSIFVNPLQFGPKEDFRDYPRDTGRDAALLESEGTDILFLPSAEAMYPEGYLTFVEVTELQDKLCGRSRPGHFRGVCTVVQKLFNIVRPDVAYFGQKDAQQVAILTRMTADLDLDVKIEVMPIVRERDGLAMSSRNTYLDPEERKAAPVLSESLTEAERMYKSGERRGAAFLARMQEILGREPLARVDYVALVDPETLEPLDEIRDRGLAALAVFIGRTRLIDNRLLGGRTT